MPTGKPHPDDIYSKQQRPRMGRRGRGGKRYRSRGPTAAGPRRHTGRFADGQNHAGGLRLWAALGLIALLLIYLGFLAVVHFSSRKDKPPVMATATSTPEAVAVATEVEPVASLPPASGETLAGSLREQIEDWQRSRETLQRMRVTVKPDEHARADQILTARLQQTPSLLELNQEVARLRVKAGDYSNAVPVLIRSIAMEPTSLEMRTMLAWSLLQTRDYEGAEVVGRWNLELEPYSNELHQIIADSLLARGMLENALPHLRVIAETTPLDLKLQNQYAMALAKAGRYERAVTIFDKLILQDPNHALTYYNLAICHSRQGNATAAFDVLKRASSQLGPDFVENWLSNADFASLRAVPDYSGFLESIRTRRAP